MSTAKSIKGKELMSVMSEVLKSDIVQRHSYFQMKYFILGKEPTVQAKLWQCLREIKSRYETIQSIILEIDDQRDNLELLLINKAREQKSANSKDELEKKEKEIKVRKIGRQIKATKESIDNLNQRKIWAEEEASFFVHSFKEFEKLEKLKPFDDIESQKEYWQEKISQEINIKMLLQNPLDIELIKTVIALPDDMPVHTQTMKMLENMQKYLLEMKTKKLEENGR